MKKSSFNFFEIFSHVVLIMGVLLMITPIWIIFASSTHPNVIIISEGLKVFPADQFFENYSNVFSKRGGFTGEISTLKMLINSFIMAFGIAILKIVISSMSAYALVYFEFKFAVFLFWLIFVTLLVPLEVRIMPSYYVLSFFNLTNTYTGLILPLIASATATFFFRQFYKSIPDELLEAAKLDGASSFQFFFDFIIPLSKTMIAALFIFLFVYGYSQYLWPLIMTSDEKYWTIVMGMKMIFSESFEGSNAFKVSERFAYIVISIIPPIIIVIFFQKWFIQGIINSEK